MTESESMVERVARAICHENGYEWQDAPLYEDHHRALARAAIAAVRDELDAALKGEGVEG